MRCTPSHSSVVSRPGAAWLPRTAGLPDDAYEHDGQITKRAIRAVTLAALAPAPGQLLWDVGAGSGSIGIEWLRAEPTARAIAIEARRRAGAAGTAERAGARRAAARRARGASAGGARRARTARMPSSSAEGSPEPGLLDACWDALRPGGRLVANAVTLESEQLLVAELRAARRRARAARGQPRRAARRLQRLAPAAADRAVERRARSRRDRALHRRRARRGRSADAARRAADRGVPGVRLRRLARAARGARARARGRPAGRHAAPLARRDRRGVARGRTSAARTSRACTRATSRSTARSASRRGGSTSWAFRWDVTPGVPAFAAAAATLRRELTLPGVAQTVILTRHSRESTAMPAGEELASLAAHGTTLVLHLAVQALDEIAATLVPHYGADCPAVVVARASWPDELVLTRHARDDRRRGARGRRAADRGRDGRAGARPGGLRREPPLLGVARAPVGAMTQPRVLLLGGTGEARELAAALTRDGVPVISSLAGRVASPRLPEGEVRVGGFGGPEALARWLRRQRHRGGRRRHASVRGADLELGGRGLRDAPRCRCCGSSARAGARGRVTTGTGSTTRGAAAAAMPALGERVFLTTGTAGPGRLRGRPGLVSRALHRPARAAAARAARAAARPRAVHAGGRAGPDRSSRASTSS